MTTYLERNDELVDKDTMDVVAWLDGNTLIIDDYIDKYAAYPNTITEIIYDYQLTPTYTIIITP